MIAVTLTCSTTKKMHTPHIYLTFICIFSSQMVILINTYWLNNCILQCTEDTSKSILYQCIRHCSKSLKIAPLTVTAAYCMSHVKLFLPLQIIKSEMCPNAWLHSKSDQLNNFFGLCSVIEPLDSAIRSQPNVQSILQGVFSISLFRRKTMTLLTYKEL